MAFHIAGYGLNQTLDTFIAFITCSAVYTIYACYCYCLHVSINGMKLLVVLNCLYGCDPNSSYRTHAHKQFTRYK